MKQMDELADYELILMGVREMTRVLLQDIVYTGYY